MGELYTLMENEEEVFNVNVSYIAVENGKSSALGGIFDFLKEGVWEEIADFCSHIPFLHYFFDSKSAGQIIVTNQRVILITTTLSGCCESNEKLAVTSISHTLLNGFNSFIHQKSCCCGSSQYQFSIGICNGSEPDVFVFETDTLSSDEEAAAVLAKFDELVKSHK